jgi:hypothetical protein
MKNNNNFLELDLLNTQPIPGESFTQEPGLRPYEKPAKITRPDDALGFMLQMLSSPKIEEHMLELLDIGISVETIVSAFVLNAFTEGVFSPDVAELIKQPLIQFITSKASEQGIEDVKILNTDTPKAMDVEDKFEIMKSINPSKFNRLMFPDDDDSMDVDEDMLEEEENVESEGFIERRNEI